ncbi:hypothetical protein SUGI_1001880 [Cryptomeria japonica]|uniref:uncharacterized protein LOC131027167 n=1 Tax=Cryptomeria japonica TaxID=3369 RepID=UPI0024147A2D|nr:uncharacterized protein LOC131027167 [Cryptomeria japonica]GLJ47466.1 hypothetical protein SUGI_1001880 [Cryptomeria japonica]
MPGEGEGDASKQVEEDKEAIVQSETPSSPVLGSPSLSSPGEQQQGNADGDRDEDGDASMVAAEEGNNNNNININKVDGWEDARAWLMTLPRRRNVMRNEIEAWFQANKHTLSRDIVTMPRQHLYNYLINQHKLLRMADQAHSPQHQMETAEWLEPPTARFKRSDKWKPIYSWLESLDCEEIVRTKTIVEWLSQNPDVREELESKHSRYHMIHYVQKCHSKILKKREKQRNVQNNRMRGQMPVNSYPIQRVDMATEQKCYEADGLQTDSRKSDAAEGNVVQKREPDDGEGVLTSHLIDFVDDNPIELKNSGSCVEEEHEPGTMVLALQAPEMGNVPKQHSGDANDLSVMGRDEAQRRYELLSELQSRLIILITKSKQQVFTPNVSSGGLVSEGNDDTEGRTRRKLRDSGQSQSDLANHSISGQARFRSSVDGKLGRKRKKIRDSLDISVHAWAQCEVSEDVSSDKGSNNSVPECQTSSHKAVHTAFSTGYRPNVVKCVQGREGGLSWPLTSVPNGYTGRLQRNWKSTFEGWDSLGKQFEGPAVWLEKKAYSSWIPTWSSYTSSVAVAQPLGRMDQSVQKVLDVRFHPHGLPQLVCSSNEAPNELLLYNLVAGRATELAGHNCQIQAVEYAAGGASIVSCGSNLVKVWDSTSGACLYTMGPLADVADSVGHKKKINALTVNRWQSCLVATSGSQNDGKLLLWNVLTGELATDINVNMRQMHSALPSIDAMEFCNQNLLVCGTDSAYGGPAMVQVWDIEAAQGCASFPANDSYITSLKINPVCDTIITGAGDGTVGLFDIRTCGGISRLSVGSNFEVTSVSFSSCGTYFHASSTANATLVWDTRMIPMNPGSMPKERPLIVADPTMHSMRPLHCLSHGKQMPTAENAGQLPGYVDEGDQGVNDARWLHNMSVLVTASGNGSVAMWNVTLGKPCIRHLISHTRCANTVAVAPNDEYICSGGDDQKVVLYHDRKGRSRTKWRLTHPLSDVQMDLDDI